MKRSLCALALAALGTAAAAAAGAAGADASALRATVAGAVWPGDIVRAADELLQAQPEAADLRELRDRAAQARTLLARNDVRLYRSAFASDDPARRQDLRAAVLGDARAAVRLALASRSHDALNGTQRYVGWMQYASLLGDREASYALALHFRRTDEPLLAAQYEARAVAQGYEPLAALDHTRK